MPSFVSRDNGHIVIVGSLAGFTGLQGAIGYGASKAALMHLSENISSDLYKMNIKVQLFNPGFVETRLTEKNSFHMPFKMSSEKAAGIIARGMLKVKKGEMESFRSKKCKEAHSLYQMVESMVL